MLGYLSGMEYGQSDSSKKWIGKSSAAAPTMLGAAAGIFLGDLMHRSARRPVALSLAVLGIAALTPTLAGAVKKKVAGPKTKRGSRKTLESIRNGGIHTGDASAYDDELTEHMHVL